MPMKSQDQAVAEVVRRIVARFLGVDTVASHDSSFHTTRRNVAKTRNSKTAARRGGNPARARARTTGRGARVRASADAGPGGDRAADAARSTSGGGPDGVREPKKDVNPIFIASAVLQQSRMAGLATTHAESGNETAAAVFDTCAQLTEMVHTELKHGVVGKVILEPTAK